MKNMSKTIAALAIIGIFSTPALATKMPDGAKIFKEQKCSKCHKMDKKTFAPAVKGMSSDEQVLRSMITKGKQMMPKYSGKLSTEDIDAVVIYLKAQQHPNPCNK